jgi:PAS domain S-box-containing protein
MHFMKVTLDFYKRLLDNLNDGVYIVNLHREIVYWSKGAERITGYANEDVIGSHCWDNILMHVDDQGNQLCRTGCPLLNVISSGIESKAELYLSHKNGHRIPVLVRATPLHRQQGEDRRHRGNFQRQHR